MDDYNGIVFYTTREILCKVNGDVSLINSDNSAENNEMLNQILLAIIILWKVRIRVNWQIVTDSEFKEL